MRLPFFVVLLLLSCFSQIHAEVLWAQKVVSFSSQYSERLYRVGEVLHKPNVFPNHTLNGCSWSPAVEAKMAYFEVAFSKSMAIKQVAIFINQSPHALSGVSITDRTGSERRLDISKVYPLGKEAKVIRLDFPLTPFEVSTVKVTFNLHGVKEMLMVDAIGISDDLSPIEAHISLDKRVSPEWTALPLSGWINTSCDELNPFVFAQGKKMLYSKKNCAQNIEGTLAHSGDIFVSTLVDGAWTAGQSFSARANNIYNNEIVGITEDEQKIYITGSYDPGSSLVKQGISLMDKDQSGIWKEPKAVVIKDFYSTDSKENTFYLHPSGQYLLMSLDRKEGIGKTDLYISLIQSDGSFGSPIHLGPVVNSAGFEFAPFLSKDARSLYFSSYGFAGYGSADIYVSERIGDGWTQWTAPLNMGPEVNSPKFDAYYRELEDGSVLFSSTRSGSKGFSDLFLIDNIQSHFKQEVVECQPVPEEFIPDSLRTWPQIISWGSHQPLGALKIIVSIDGSVIQQFNTSDTTISFPYRKGFMIQLELSSPLVPTQVHSIITTDSGKMHTLKLGLLNRETAFSSNNILFERDASILLPESYPTLNRLALWIKEQQQLKIQISGHTEPGGNKSYNRKLSENRAKAVKDYLVSKGVSPKQLVAKGFGGSKPLQTGNDLESRSANRRVEFLVLP